MNYYERHLGDYARDAGHLSMLEHGAYTLLLDRYYTTEKPIPQDQAHRVCRARTREEKDAVDSVLAEFFTLKDGNWFSSRAEREIAKYNEAEPEREAKRENAKERQRRARERRRELFEELRTFGVVPEYDTSTAELHAALSRVKSRTVTPPVTRDDTATQPQTPTPVLKTKEQTPAAIVAHEDPKPPSAPTSSAAAACKAMREAGMPPTYLSESNLRLQLLLAKGATPEQFAAYVPIALQEATRDPLAYVCGAVDKDLLRAKAVSESIANGVMPPLRQAFPVPIARHPSDDKPPPRWRIHAARRNVELSGKSADVESREIVARWGMTDAEQQPTQGALRAIPSSLG
jgi:uncharacterized protein YdaU (DUF1376 family)